MWQKGMLDSEAFFKLMGFFSDLVFSLFSPRDKGRVTGKL